MNSQRDNPDPRHCDSATWEGGGQQNKEQPKKKGSSARAFAWPGRQLLTLVMCVCWLVVGSSAQPTRIAPELKRRAPDELVTVIVQYRHAPHPANVSKAAKRGAEFKGHLPLIKSAVYRMPARAVLELVHSDPSVLYVTPDRPLKGMALDYTAQTVNAPAAWSAGLTGAGVGVAVIDSGINLVKDLKTGDGPAATSRIVYSQNFADDAGTNDLYGHGTHVAGLIAGAGQSSKGRDFTYTVEGIAPGANLINLRVLDAAGNSTDSAVIAAIETAISLQSKYNIRVLNLSLGRQVFESYQLDPLCQAVEQAWQAGIVVVVAAGNQGRNNSAGTNGYGTIAAPGNDPYVITVGAMNTIGTGNRSDDLITSYSSKGPTTYDEVVKPDLVAPGNKSISLLAQNSTLWNALGATNHLVNKELGVGGPAGNGNSNAYWRLSGTSMAAPVVSGAAALMLQADPTLTPDTVKARLMKTASKAFPSYSSITDPSTGITYTEQYDIFTIGAGYLDIAAALASTEVVPAGLNAESPTASYDPATGNTYLVGGQSVVWGSSVMWGSSVVWGSSVLWGSSVTWGSSVLWGSSVTWGSSTQQGFSVIWGSSVVWGSSANQGLEVAVGDN